MTECVPVPRCLVRRLWLSVGGALFFFVVSTIHGAFVPGFDPWHQSVSALALAPLGWHARSVFFVSDAGRLQRFYTEQLGFAMDWDHQEQGRTVVCQVGLLGFELILNEADDGTRARVGQGRVFIGHDDDQVEPLRTHIVAAGIQTQRVQWGRPTLLVRDLDANELFFWPPHYDWTSLQMPGFESD